MQRTLFIDNWMIRVKKKDKLWTRVAEAYDLLFNQRTSFEEGACYSSEGKREDNSTYKYELIDYDLLSQTTGGILGENTLVYSIKRKPLLLSSIN